MKTYDRNFSDSGELPKWKLKKQLRERFVNRAKYYLSENKRARSQLAKCFGKSVANVSADILSLLFSVMDQEIYDNENIRSTSSEILEPYFFTLTMMAFYFKSEENKELGTIESKLKYLYFTQEKESTKRRIRILLSRRIGNSGIFQRELSSLTKLLEKEQMTNLNYYALLQDLCEWNHCSKGSVSKSCYKWSKEIFLRNSQEE